MNLKRPTQSEVVIYDPFPFNLPRRFNQLAEGRVEEKHPQQHGPALVATSRSFAELMQSIGGGRPNILSFSTKRVDWRTPGDAPNDYIPEIYLSEADFSMFRQQNRFVQQRTLPTHPCRRTFLLISPHETLPCFCMQGLLFQGNKLLIH
jgi:hypothetical protein